MNDSARAALVLCTPDEAERLALRGFDAISPAGDASTAELAAYRARVVRVAPAATRERAGVAAVLCTLSCDVFALPLAFDADRDDPVTASVTPMFVNGRLKAAEALPKTFRGRSVRAKLFALLLRLKAEGLLSEDSVWTPAKHKAAIWRVTALGRSEMSGVETPPASTC